MPVQCSIGNVALCLFSQIWFKNFVTKIFYTTY